MNEREAYMKGMQDLAGRLTRYFELLGDKAYGPLVAYHVKQIFENLKNEFERKGENNGKQDDQGPA